MHSDATTRWVSKDCRPVNPLNSTEVMETLGRKPRENHLRHPSEKQQIFQKNRPSVAGIGLMGV